MLLVLYQTIVCAFERFCTRKYQTITDDEEKLEIQFSRLTQVDFRTSGFKLCIHLLIKLKKKNNEQIQKQIKRLLFVLIGNRGN